MFAAIAQFFGARPETPAVGVPQTKFAEGRDAVPGRVYDCIGRENVLVVGSYALEQFLPKPKWHATDIDFCMPNKKVFDQAVERLRAAGACVSVSKSEYSPFASDEATVVISGMVRPLHLFHVGATRGGIEVEDAYRRFSDRVGQVTYRIDKDGRRIFSVPEDCRHIAVEGTHRSTDTADSDRWQKYVARLRGVNDWVYTFGQW